MTRDHCRSACICSVVIALRHRDDGHNGPANARWAAAGAHYTIVRPFRRRRRRLCRSARHRLGAAPTDRGDDQPAHQQAAASSPRLSHRGSLVFETARPSAVCSVAERARRFLPTPLRAARSRRYHSLRLCPLVARFSFFRAFSFFIMHTRYQ